MRLTEKQAAIIRIMQDLGSATISDFEELEQTETATVAHMKRLILLGQVYVSHWNTTKNGIKPVYKLGNYPSITRSEAAQQLNAQRRADKQKIKQPDVNNFDFSKPRADVAAAWMFNDVEKMK